MGGGDGWSKGEYWGRKWRELYLNNFLKIEKNINKGKKKKERKKENLLPDPQSAAVEIIAVCIHGCEYLHICSLICILQMQYNNTGFPFNFFIKTSKTFCFEIVLYLQKSCKGNTESFCLPFSFFFNVNILHNHGTFVKTKKFTLVQYY